MNFTSLKKKAVQRLYEKEYKKLQKTDSKKINTIKTIGILANASLFGSYDISRNLTQKLNKPHKSFEIIIFENLKDDFVTKHYNTFSEKDFGVYGKVKSENLLGFIDTKYDLLINYCNPEIVFTNMVALRSKASFKVSFADEKVSDLYNFTIAIKGNQIDVFNDELAKYLQILGLI